MKDFLSREYWRELFKQPAVRWNFIYILILTILSLGLGFYINWLLGVMILLVTLLGSRLSISRLRTIVVDAHEYLADLTYQIEQGQQEALLEMPLGMILMNKQGEIQWINPYMAKYFDLKIVVGKKLKDVDSELAKLESEHRNRKTPEIVTWEDHQFEFLVQKDNHVIYMMDVTNYEKISRRYKQQQIFLGNIYLDNYVELTQGMSDSDVSNLHNYVTSEISKWAIENHLLMKVIDDDNYLIIGHQISLKRLEEKKFKILDIIRENTSKQNSPVTLSVGIAYGENDLIKLANTAQNNLDLALGRGGDQVVVRGHDSETRFYGGKTNPMEKRTRVRARMISQALQELMAQADQLFVMGHENPDMDSLGACLGIRRIAAMNNRECWIVVDEEQTHSDIQRLLKQMDNYQEIKEHVITPEEALEKVTPNSLLVMVDHAKKGITIAPELYERLQNRLVIIDHHRRGEEFPENPLLVYIEPYASSTCELITEMFEYQPREEKGLNKLEATAMLTGIQIDTKSFTKSAGTRTFDAASYLRSAGADGMMIQMFMKENADSFMKRNHLISRAALNNSIAICAGEDDQTYDPVTAAQAADMLLQVNGIEASFVITKRADGMVCISARSMGDVNVQLIMEKMGGGGHLANAATQIKGKTISEVKKILIDQLNKTEDDSSEEITEE
ncbi:DHH family phosphoesterase [Limosilactobacillus fastidiosus]|uniref:Cyclic-di-AMP phosphodiesterase n=1 Tax=Limosilactobacillus fastidiosus TaxID=2759855 RepID=A0A7W3TYI5_9LACO|nr:DHH family phosphoesterase [Limosilactobacillus fastidiosus]MBB1062497.1 DHH family phosphoesterase [Limosilactobacillus fastidiosus]MBB1085552.1 DHH family phosphoesterase [Limosilactobacillus fastidiosus]MCD7083571.1 DHH family phosphoesterase [Limosilactobacillus fastidiosus]MCD7086005.1 DHH family phosphoesterase [Limosilactobacillus fastidiosus]MCD7114351.1 DHH family phosphoesterase [Limosilactobacillus fastidiosus]